MAQYNRVGLVGRFKPLHLGATGLLESICEQSREVIIGIGSSNRYDVRNPFTAEETHTMIDLILEKYDNYEVVYIPDYGHDKGSQYWIEEIEHQFGELDALVSGNTYVSKLLCNKYDILHPREIVPPEQYVHIVHHRGSKTRAAMMGNSWKDDVSPVLVPYIENHLLERFRKEFGDDMKKIMQENDWLQENAEREKQHITGLM